MKRWSFGLTLLALFVGCDSRPIPVSAVPKGPVTYYPPAPQILPADSVVTVVESPSMGSAGGPPINSSATAIYTQRTSQLHEAAEKGRVSLLAELVKQGADVNDKSDDGQTALHLASANGHKSVVVTLLALGADMSERNDKGQTALIVAAAAGNAEIVSLLNSPSAVADLAKGALTGLGESFKLDLGGLGDRLSSTSFNASQLADKQGRTALMHAAANGHKECVEHLLEYQLYASRERLEKKDRQGQNVLMIAAEAGHVDIVDRLLHRWGDTGPTSTYLKATDGTGKSALDLAKSAGHAPLVKMLTIELAVQAAREGDVAAVKAALEDPAAGIEPAQLMKSACLGGSLAVVNHLKLTFKDKPAEEKLRLMSASLPTQSMSCLYSAIYSGNAPLATALLDRAWWNDEKARKAFIDFGNVLKTIWNGDAAAVAQLVEAARKECEEAP